MYVSRKQDKLRSIYINVISDEQTTGYAEESTGYSEKSFVNISEVEAIEQTLKAMKTGGLIRNRSGSIKVSSQDVMIVTPYNGQARFLRFELNKIKDEYDVRSIDSSQGAEQKIVLISLVLSKAVGFLKLSQRIIVGLSRAKEVMLIFGNSNFFENQQDSKLLKDLVKRHKDNDRYFSNVKSLLNEQ
jgi:superfamily I DNA and/or RNA helicase